MIPFRVYYQNVCGFRTKTTTFLRNILCSYDILCLTETWLNDSFHNNDLFDDHFMVWRRDRNYELTGQDFGGGVLVAVRRNQALRFDLNGPRVPRIYGSPCLWKTIIVDLVTKCTLVYKLNYICDQNLGNSKSTQLFNLALFTLQPFNHKNFFT